MIKTEVISTVNNTIKNLNIYNNLRNLVTIIKFQIKDISENDESKTILKKISEDTSTLITDIKNLSDLIKKQEG